MGCATRSGSTSTRGRTRSTWPTTRPTETADPDAGRPVRRWMVIEKAATTVAYCSRRHTVPGYDFAHRRRARVYCAHVERLRTNGRGAAPVSSPSYYSYTSPLFPDWGPAASARGRAGVEYSARSRLGSSGPVVRAQAAVLEWTATTSRRSTDPREGRRSRTSHRLGSTTLWTGVRAGRSAYGWSTGGSLREPEANWPDHTRGQRTPGAGGERRLRGRCRRAVQFSSAGTTDADGDACGTRDFDADGRVNPGRERALTYPGRRHERRDRHRSTGGGPRRREIAWQHDPGGDLNAEPRAARSSSATRSPSQCGRDDARSTREGPWLIIGHDGRGTASSTAGAGTIQTSWTRGPARANCVEYSSPATRTRRGRLARSASDEWS